MHSLYLHSCTHSFTHVIVFLLSGWCSDLDARGNVSVEGFDVPHLARTHSTWLLDIGGKQALPRKTCTGQNTTVRDRVEEENGCRRNKVFGSVQMR
jgi:hypothetical protein